jgi:hypothetical protein
MTIICNSYAHRIFSSSIQPKETRLGNQVTVAPHHVVRYVNQHAAVKMQHPLAHNKLYSIALQAAIQLVDHLCQQNN